MYTNIYYETKKNTIHLWEKIKGEKFYDEILWTPYCFVSDSKGDIKTVENEPVSKKYFKSYKAYQDFCKSNHNGVYENKVVPSIQYLAERYHNIQMEDIDPPELKIYSLDIEVHLDRSTGNTGFPNQKDTLHPIVLITVTDMSDEKVYSFGLHSYKDTTDYNVVYYNCKNEQNLLKSFFGWWNKNCPDVVTGWNINADYKINLTGGFDLPYIINRTKLLFGDDTKLYKKLSPLNIVSMHEKENSGSFVVDIAGVSIIDYLSVYKWYTANNLDSYTLENVCQHEINRGKIEYDNDLEWLYFNDWKKYVEYNIEDTFLINDLEKKLGYIKLAQTVTMLCRCPLKMFSSTKNLVEGLMMTRFRRNGQCAPYFAGGTQKNFPAAYVKEPISNKYNWIFSLDIASSYPHAIVTLNMSKETLYGKITNLYEDEIMVFAFNKIFPPFKLEKDGVVIDIKNEKLETFNKAIKRKIFSVAPNGVIFYNDKPGSYASMERDMYLKRKEIKRLMFEKNKEYLKTKKSSIKRKVENLNTLQKSYKVIINGAYGACAVPYSRYFSSMIAEAITSVGRCSVKQGEKFTNEILNNPNDEIKQLLSKL